PRQASNDFALGELDKTFGLRARDESAPVRRECQAEELLEATDIGDGLARCPSIQRLPEGGLGARVDPCFRMGEHTSAVDPYRASEQQLDVEPCSFGARCS